MYGASKPPPHASYYSPKFVPGARLPHAWIKIVEQPSLIKRTGKHSSIPHEPVDVSYIKELDANKIKTCQWSTLDLCGPDSWTVILGRDHTGSHVSQFKQHCDAIHVRLNVWCLGADFELVQKNWFEDEALNNGGLLVRPDQHILTRFTIYTRGEELFTELKRHIGL